MIRPTLHFYLSSDAAGHQSLDPADPTASAYGGGSRAGFLGLVRAVGRLDKFDVTAFACFPKREYERDGIQYIRIDNQPKYGWPDVSFSFYDGRFIHGSNRSRLRIHSLHTYLPFHPGFPWPHVWTAPSEHAAAAFRRAYRPRDPVHVLPNAVEGLEGVEWRPVRGRCVWQTSPDRGLHLLLEAWPEIRARVPYATLHVGGEPKDVVRDGLYLGLDGIYENDRATRMARALVRAQEVGGLTLYGRVSRGELLKELSEAACVSLPFEMSMPSETFSISVLEACTIGIPVVMSPEDALGEVYRNSGVVLTRAPADQYLPEFVDAVVRMLTDEEHARECSRREREFAGGFSFDNSARILSGLIDTYLLKAVG